MNRRTLVVSFLPVLFGLKLSGCLSVDPAAFVLHTEKADSKAFSGDDFSRAVIHNLEQCPPEPSSLARKIIEGRCGCHGPILTPGGMQGLNYIGRERSPDWIRVQIRNPKAHGSGMPSFPRRKLSDKDLWEVVGYLSRLKQYKLGRQRFEFDEIRNPDGLLSRLRSESHPFITYVRDRLPERTRQILKNDQAVLMRKHLEEVKEEMNGLILWNDIYKPELLTNMALSPGTRSLIAHRKKYPELWRVKNGGHPAIIALNRRLMADAFPDHLSPIPKGFSMKPL